MPTINKLKKEWGIYPKSSGTELTEDKMSIIDNLQEILGLEQNIFVEQNYTLYQNISNFYGLFWGQRILALKEEIIGLDNYGIKSNEYN